MNIKKIIYILSALGLLFFGFHKLLLRQTDSLETVASYIVYPVLLFQNSFVKPIEKSYRNWLSNKELQAKLQQAQDTIDAYQAENIKLLGIKELAESTAELRDFSQRYYPQSYLAHSIMKEFDTHHIMGIDIGSNKGIELDMVAIYKNCIIGRVSSVYPLWSKVTLLTDPSCKIAAFTAKTRKAGILEGMLSLQTISLAFISHLQHVEEGELVFSSGEGLVFPRGYALGTVKQVHTDGFNLAIDVEPMLDLTTIEYCYIVKKGAVAPYDQSLDI